MGRKPTPTNLRILRGDRPDRINGLEPQPDESAGVTPPYELRPAAADVWNRLAPDLTEKGVLTAWDVDQFAVFCDAAATYQEAREHLDTEGYVATGSTGSPIKSPWFQILRDAVSIMTTIGSRFGLTPADRSHIAVSGKPDTGLDAARLLT